MSNVFSHYKYYIDLGKATHTKIDKNFLKVSFRCCDRNSVSFIPVNEYFLELAYLG